MPSRTSHYGLLKRILWNFVPICMKFWIKALLRFSRRRLNEQNFFLFFHLLLISNELSPFSHNNQIPDSDLYQIIRRLSLVSSLDFSVAILGIHFFKEILCYKWAGAGSGLANLIGILLSGGLQGELSNPVTKNYGTNFPQLVSNFWPLRFVSLCAFWKRWQSCRFSTSFTMRKRRFSP